MRRTAAVLAGFLAAWPAVGEAQDPRFAVVDLVPTEDSEKLVTAVEREIARLRPGQRPIDDPVMRRLLGIGEGPAQTAVRLHKEAETAYAGGDCDTAVNRAQRAEPMILASLSLDEERDLLKSLYGMLIMCADKRGKPDEIKVPARRLRGLVSLPPAEFPLALWEQHVANATAAAATVELQVDSDPANAQIAVNFHGEGVTPRTLKVAPGVIYVEVQKDGYKKAFRSVEVKTAPVRVVLRLVSKSQDRMEQAEVQAGLVRRGEADRRPLTLSRLSQLARVDTLVLLSTNAGRVKVQFFDAERGGIAGETIESEYDPATGKVAALSSRPTPAGAGKPATGVGGKPSATPERAAQAPTATPSGEKQESESEPEGKSAESLPEARAQEQYAQFKPRRDKPGAPWWSWVIAGAIAGAFFVYVFADREKQSPTIGVRARWAP